MTVIKCLHIFQVENIRRKHNYLPLIMELLKVLAKQGNLVPLVEKVLNCFTCKGWMKQFQQLYVHVVQEIPRYIKHKEECFIRISKDREMG